MKSLLGRITSSESPDSIDKHGQLMANKIRTVQRNRKKMVTEELKAVIAERDAAVEKVRRSLFISQQFEICVPSLLLNSTVGCQECEGYPPL